jgi:ABC-2 type transport system permease protein
MIRRTLLIGWQEFAKYVTRRGFLISLLLFPLLLIIAAVVPNLSVAHPRTAVIAVADQTGGFREALAAKAAHDQARAELAALAEYARRNADLRRLEQRAPAWAKLLRAPGSNAVVRAFQARGGWQEGFAVVSPLLKSGAPVFTPPKPEEVVVPAPADLDAALKAGNAGAALAYLNGVAQVPVAGEKRRLSAVVVIPADFASTAEAQYWSLGEISSQDFVRTALSEALRLKAVARLAPEAQAVKALDTEAALQSVDPAQGRRLSLTDSMARYVPIWLAFLLFIVAFSNAALLLQSVVEEKSSRMVEVLLSCASPHEIMTGKLIGVAALALVTVAAWALVLFAAASFISAEAIAVVLAGLEGLLPVLPLVLLYFFCGLLIYASIFLGIGATTTSLPDAQTLVGPASLIIVLPNMFLAMLVQDPNGPLAQIISWIPIYTPFFMLVRLPFHPAPVELWATGVLVVLTTVFLIRQTGRIFARNVLTTERPPAMGAFLGQILRRKAG